MLERLGSVHPLSCWIWIYVTDTHVLLITASVPRESEFSFHNHPVVWHKADDGLKVLNSVG